MRAVLFVAASLLPAASYGSPLFSNEYSRLVTRQEPGSYYPITGATGGVFPRLEIRELERAGGEMWNLFLLALTEFQAMDQNVINSYYQIAGRLGFQNVTRFVVNRCQVFMVCPGMQAFNITCANTDDFRTSWDGVEGRLEDLELEDGSIVKKLPDMGYCPHNQVLFGTWHRPYLVLFEVSVPSTYVSLPVTKIQ